MTIQEIANQAIAIVSPYLVEAAKGVTAGIGESIWKSISNLFKKGNKEETLNKLAQDATNQELQSEMEAHLASMLYSEEGVRKELEGLITSYNNIRNTVGNTVVAANNQKSQVAGGNISGNKTTFN